MNQSLQNILNIIQQSEHLSDDEKNALLKAVKDTDKEIAITEFKLDRTEKVKRTTAILLEETIAELEQKRKAVEEQNRELSVEASLERVRAVAMSMMKPGDLLNICEVIFKELQTLGFLELRNSLINIFNDDRGSFLNYDYSDDIGASSTTVPYNAHPFIERQLEQIKSANDAFSQTILTGHELKDWIEARRRNGEKDDPRLENTESLYYYFYSIGKGAIGISTLVSIDEKKLDLLKRFRNVFNLSYQRYMDIAQAEAQARESQIQLALERVRARTMAMHNSSELGEVAVLLFEQVKHLGIENYASGFNIWDKEQKHVVGWMSNPTNTINPPFEMPIQSYAQHEKIFKAWKNHENFLEDDITGKDIIAHYRFLRSFPLLDAAFKKSEAAGIKTPNRQVHNIAFFSKGYLLFITLEPCQQFHDIFIRFAKVFEQTYTRFLDLQKAEAQARESQIQLALERVRARTMAMQKSDELGDTASVLFKQLHNLGLKFWSAGVFIWKTDDGNLVENWMGNNTGGASLSPMVLRFKEDDKHRNIYEASLRGELMYEEELKGEALKKHYDWLNSHSSARKVFEQLKDYDINLPLAQWNYAAIFKQGYLLIIAEEPTPDIKDISKLFAKVFEQTYTRFLDLQKAEAQTRESQIQLALERVRARTMAMQKSEDLNQAASDMFKQIQSLGIQPWACGFNIFDKDEKAVTQYMSLADGGISPPFRTPLTEDPFFINIYDARQRREELLVMKSEGESLSETYRYMFSLPGSKEIFGDLENSGFAMPKFQITHCAYFSQGYLVFITYEQVSEAHDIFKRFARVFEQTYTRFLDLQKAEAQAREAQIETALEKVRSRSLAMHRSDELEEVIMVVSDQLQQLQFRFHNVSFVRYDDKQGLHFWLASPGRQLPFLIEVPYLDNPAFNRPLEARKNGIDFIADILTLEENHEWLNHLVTHSWLKNFSDDDKKNLMKTGGFARSIVLMKQIMLVIGNYASVPYTEEQNLILRRFANVFDQAYTRFHDLQRAEAQARESQIQLALERVRARTMAMQKSNELSEAVYILFQQFKELGENPDQATIGVINEKEQLIEYWVTMYGNQMNKVFKFPIDEPNVTHKIYKAWKANKKSLVIDLSGKELYEFAHYRENMGGAKFNPNEKRRVINVAFFSKGLLNVQSNEKRSGESIKLLERFASVFEQTYTRFLDLQKAEAQTREAQIEAALERVRSKTMAMHNSNDVGETVATMFAEFVHLGIHTNRCGILIFRDESFSEVWTAKADPERKSSLVIGSLNLNRHGLLSSVYKAWKAGDTFYQYNMMGDDLVNYYRNINDQKDYPVKFDLKTLPSKEFHSDFFFPEGAVFSFTNEPIAEEHAKIFKRFSAVFGQTYRRYLDLLKAEAQAREAQIEAALEKVRSRTLAMQKSDELAETAAVLFQQLIHLGIEPNRLYISLIQNEAGDSEFWITDEDGSKVSMAYQDNLLNNPTFKQMFDGWMKQEKSLVIDMKGEELQQYFKYLSSIHVPFKGGMTQQRRLQYIAYFSKGFIGMAAPDEQPAETLQLLERFAYVFNLTFTRFNDLQISEAHALQAEQDLIKIKEARKKAEEALTELQVTQKQLIHSEKMASLGELTAGIAHEIQNPLNFVNNFSDVSTELIDEMNEEITKGNLEDAKEIANDLKQNLEKINHHGKRAGDIVKGMLQHSRTSSGQKELTDINALCDEYLRLAYHGLRAKDKSFNAKFETSFDETIPKINVVPQDMGRVILNLINNAFFAVSEKKKSDIENCEPTVSVQTKKSNDKIEIRVTDNGNGIPQNILDKIFQPFFTTKPTGQGTGLGLSLSYDIVKAHGGEIKVETKENEGTEFIIQLPV